MGGWSDVDWNALFTLSLPLAEILVRGTAMYWFLFLIFRFVVRRELGGVGVGDILIMVIVADAAQNSMSGEYTSITDGCVLVATLIGWNVLIDWLAFRYRAVRRILTPRSLRLVQDGRMLKRHMRREFISEEELMGELRQAGVESLEKVKAAYLESDGQISVIKSEG